MTNTGAVERAARALWGCWNPLGPPWSAAREQDRDEARAQARAALAAAAPTVEQVAEVLADVLASVVAEACDRWQRGWDGGAQDVAEELQDAALAWFAARQPVPMDAEQWRDMLEAMVTALDEGDGIDADAADRALRNVLAVAGVEVRDV